MHGLQASLEAVVWLVEDEHKLERLYVKKMMEQPSQMHFVAELGLSLM